MKKTLLTLVVVLLFAGCSGKDISINDQTSKHFTNKSVQLQIEQKADFVCQTPLRVILTTLVDPMLAYTSDDNNSLQDPAVNIGQNLLKTLKNRYSLRVVQDDKADYMLNLHTVMWGMIYLPFHWNHYKLYLNIHMELLDAKTQKVIAQGYCAKESDSENAPTYEEFFDNDAQLLKKTVHILTNQCLDEFQKLF